MSKKVQDTALRISKVCVDYVNLRKDVEGEHPRIVLVGEDSDTDIKVRLSISVKGESLPLDYDAIDLDVPETEFDLYLRPRHKQTRLDKEEETKQ